MTLALDKDFPAEKETRTKILDAATALFGSRGYKSVRVVEIAAKAGVNVALINYYFRSKEDLFHAVAGHACATIVKRRLSSLEEVTAKKNFTLEEVLATWLVPSLQQLESEGAIIPHINSTLYATEVEGLPDNDILNYLTNAESAYIDAIAKCCPELTRSNIVWRFYCMIGAFSYLMGQKRPEPVGMAQLSNGACNPHDADEVLREILPFLVAGFQAPPPRKAVGMPEHRDPIPLR